MYIYTHTQPTFTPHYTRIRTRTHTHTHTHTHTYTYAHTRAHTHTQVYAVRRPDLALHSWQVYKNGVDIQIYTH